MLCVPKFEDYKINSCKRNAMDSKDPKEDTQELGKESDFIPRVRKAEYMRYDNQEEKAFLWMPAILCGTGHVN